MIGDTIRYFGRLIKTSFCPFFVWTFKKFENIYHLFIFNFLREVQFSFATLSRECKQISLATEYKL